jgi:hypothetical protein
VDDAKASLDPVTAKRAVLQTFNTRAGGQKVDSLKIEGTSNTLMGQAKQETLLGYRGDQVVKKVGLDANAVCGTHDFVPCFPECERKAGQEKENFNSDFECENDIQGSISYCSDLRNECEF